MAGDPQNPALLRYWDGTQWSDQTRPMITEQADAQVGAGPAQYSGPPIMIVTTNGWRLPHHQRHRRGLRRDRPSSCNAFSNMGASFRTMFGGEVRATPNC